MEALEPRVLLDGVIISEFMAINDEWLLDGNNEDSDWLEIHNPGTEAVDLTGWKLRDDNNEWTFPTLSLGPGEYRILFASSVDDADWPYVDPAGYLHTNFGLKGDGEYLGLFDNLDALVHEYDQYPQQFENISYGIAQDIQTTEYVSSGDQARYLVPSGDPGNWTVVGFDDNAWSTGDTALGFADTTSGLAVWNYKANIQVGTLGMALQVIDNPGMQSYVNSENAPVIDYENSNAPGHYGNNTQFPGFSAVLDDFVVEAKAFVTIPSAGQWTFGVNSDDGFQLTVAGATTTAVYNSHTPAGGDTISFADPRGPGDTLGVFDFPSAGVYELRLVFYERGGGSGLEMFAAQGAYGSWNSGDFDLVGDTAAGGLAVVSEPVSGGGGGGGFAGLIETDVEGVMKDINASMFVRLPFTLADPTQVESLRLRMKYDDGYVAYLNGQPIAEQNAPPSPLWNSNATDQRNDLQATTWENVDATDYLESLVIGDNVLAVHAMNYAVGDGDFLVLPELVEIAYLGLGEHYFATASPNDANTEEYWLYVEDTNFDHDRGFYDEPFNVEITTDTDGATIVYTTDGSEPTLTNGTQVEAASPDTPPVATVSVSTTTTLRAAAFKQYCEPTNVDTQTYIFLDDVINQPSNPAGFPTSWNAEPADYEMDPVIIGDPLYSDTLKDDLLSIPTMSIVMDVADMFGPSGIYSNPNNQGVGWERSASLEYFDPNSTDEFQIDAGARMYGGVGRNPGFKKHSFRFLFKADYGPTKLQFPLFGDDATDEFDTIILRSNFNDAWVWGGAPTQFVRDEFAGQLQKAMGDAGRDGNFVHLYVNGLYWGLYNPCERPDTSFSATYYGGDKEDWDGINSGNIVNTGGLTQAEINLRSEAWNTLMAMSNGLANNVEYQRVQGNNLDGTNNPTYEDYLDIDNYINFLLLNQWAGNNDWGSHNWYAGRMRGPDSTGFKSYSWDAEWIVNMRSGLNDNTVNDTTTSNWLLKPYTYLRNNAEFRLRYADHIHKLMFNGGVLSPEYTGALYQSLADLVEQSVKAETARWGDVVREPAYDLDDWTNERDYILNTYLPGRTGIVLDQLEAANLYPNIVAPTFNINGSYQHGGTIDVGDSLTMGPQGATIYYTTDGSDPRELYGGIATGASVYSGAVALNGSTHVKSRVYNNAQWSALNEATYYIDLAPDIRLTEIMYNPAEPTQAEFDAGYTSNNDFEYIEIKNISATETLPLAGLRFTDGIDFTFGGTSVGPGEYAVVVKNQAAFQHRYSSFTGTIAGQYTGSLRNSGEQIRLDSPIGGVIHDFEYNDTWYDHTDGDGFSLTIRDPGGLPELWDLKEGWRASAAPGGTPGYGDTLADPESIIVTEVLAHSDALVQDAIELYNASASAVDISGWWLSDDKTNDLGAETLTKYQIPAMAPMAPGDYVVFYENTSFGIGPTPFALNELGDDVYLSSNAAGVAGGYREHVDFGASPADVSIGLHVKSTGGTDFTLLSAVTLGLANAHPYFDDLVINEVMYHPADPTASEIAAGYLDEDDFEFIEIYNSSTTTTRTLSDFYLSSGIGFTFGWYGAAGDERESWTLEPGATATWNATLPAGPASYEVFARWDLLDGEGDERDLDGQARYAITHDGGTTEVIRDQKPEDDDEGPGYIDEFGWVSLGVYSFDGGGQVVLTRGTDNPDNWTIADQVKFVRSGHSDVIVDGPALDSWYTTNGPATLGPGGYVVIVKNYDAFDERYDIAGNSIPVAGQYTGNLSNNGEKVKLQRVGDPEPWPSYFIPYYRIDYVNYNDNLPWPEEPDGTGPSLNRIDPADPYPYGNDPGNWVTSAAIGSPGEANTFVDTTPPTVPQNLVALVGLVGGTQIELSWGASTDPGSYVDHYVIYRDGQAIGTTGTTGYDDTDVQLVTPYVYEISAVNRDMRESDRSAEAAITIPGIISYSTPDETHVKLVFSEALDEASAVLLTNYTFVGGTLEGAALETDQVTVTLTTSELVIAQEYTITVDSLQTVSTMLMPEGQYRTFIYAPVGEGIILWEYWLGIGGGNAVANLTGNPNYPDNPTNWDLLTTFEGPTDWQNNYGSRIRGYVHPPETGNYTFWIASDDNSELWLSTDDHSGNAVLIASVPGWTGPRGWNNYPQQQSAAIALSAGQKYYIEALQKEGTGGDNLAVRWQLPGGVWENPGNPGMPIPGIRLSPYDSGDVDLTPPSTPGNVDAQAVSSTRIDLAWLAAVDAESGINEYVIYRNGSEIATTDELTLTYTDNSADQAQTYIYSVSAVNGDGLEGGARVAEAVSPPPNIESVLAVGQTTVLVTFGEPVDEGTANVVGNYSITYPPSGSVGILSAVWDPGNTDQVTLMLSELLVESRSYTLGVEQVEDASANPVLPGESMQFVYSTTDVPALWTFNADADGFEYADDTFNNTSSPDRAMGERVATGGYGSSGGLRVYLGTGGWFNPNAFSGGWSRSFLTSHDGLAEVSVWYRMRLGEGFESNEYGEAILEIDGTRYGAGQNNSLVRMYGNGNGGSIMDSGWQIATFEVPVTPGNRTITIGAHVAKSTAGDEWVEVYIDDVQIDIIGANTAPFFTSTSLTDAVEDALYSYSVTADDADPGDTLAITAPTLPDWLTLTNHGDGTATLAGTPLNEHVGDHAVVLRVTDPGAAYDDQPFTITVANTNDEPLVDDQAFGVDEHAPNDTVVGTVLASDPDPADTLAWAIVDGNTDDAFAINSETGLLTVNNSAALDSETTPVFSLTVEVTDDGAPAMSDTATVTVSLPDTTGPTFDAWYSAADHAGGVGEAKLVIPDDNGFVEPRRSGIARLLIDFSEEIDTENFTPASIEIAGMDVTDTPFTPAVAVTTSTRDSARGSDTVGVIELAPALPNMARYVVNVSNVTDVAGNPAIGRTSCVMLAMVGDVSGDERTSGGDLSITWDRRTPLISAADADQVRADISRDGRVSSSDLSIAWGYRGDGSDISIPELPGGKGAAMPATQGLASPGLMMAALAARGGEGIESYSANDVAAEHETGGPGALPAAPGVTGASVPASPATSPPAAASAHDGMVSPSDSPARAAELEPSLDAGLVDVLAEAKSIVPLSR